MSELQEVTNWGRLHRGRGESPEVGWSPDPRRTSTCRTLDRISSSRSPPLGAKAWICWIHRRPTTYVTAEIRPPDVTLLPILPYAVDLSHPVEPLGRLPVDWAAGW